MKAADLRKSILQAAVQGKLVPQDKNDEPASELLKRIQTEKSVQIKEGKLKKEKLLPPIAEDEIPYDLPDGWVWTHLQTICTLIGDIDHNMPKSVTKENGVLFLSAKDLMDDGTINYDTNVKYISVEDFERLSRKALPQVGDIIYSRIGACLGKARIVTKDIKFLVSYSCCTIRALHLNTQYICYLLESSMILEHANSKKQSIGVPDLGMGEIKKFYVPLPPLSEQQRIVARVDELIAMCDELEAVEKELDALESHFFDYLPKSILQAAVQGKLVPQDKDDEPAFELLKRIRTEKTALIKEGKLKKEKPLPPITEDEIPYDLPEGWAWCRLGEMILSNTGGGTPSKQNSAYWNGAIPWASVKDLNCDVLTHTIDSITDLGLCESTSNLIPANNVIICTRMGLGKIVINTIPVAINQDLRALTLPKEIVQKYFVYWYKTLIIEGGGMTVKGITLETLNNFAFPIPPLTEQQRIVVKVDELMALCEEIKYVDAQPIDHSNVIPFPAKVEVNDAESIKMAAQGKVAAQPSKQHTAALDDLLGMMDDE